MNRSLIAIAILVLFSLSAAAEDRIVGLSPSSKSSLDLYEAVGGPSASKLEGASLKFPISILEKLESGRFLKIKADGKEYLVKARDVKVELTSTVECVTGNDKPGLVGATPGIGGTACK